MNSLVVLETEKLSQIKGGSLADWIDASCAAWGLVNVATAGAVNANPVGSAASAFCVGWGIARLFG